MTHLPFIVASYAVFVVVSAWAAIAGALRLRAAERRLNAVDPRRARERAA